MSAFAQTLTTLIENLECQEKKSKSYGIVLIYSMPRSEQRTSQTGINSNKGVSLIYEDDGCCLLLIL